jgi:NADPH:quinone reductase-like Zn-dependent oxidoreductase
MADTVGAATASKVIARVETGGVFASVAGTPRSPICRGSICLLAFRRGTFQFMAEAARDGKLVIPIGEELPLSEAAEAQAAGEKGSYREDLASALKSFWSEFKK